MKILNSFKAKITAVTVIIVVTFVVMTLVGYQINRTELEKHMGLYLRGVAVTTGLMIDGDKHESIISENSWGFEEIRDQLRAVKAANGLSSEIYTLEPVEGATRFVVMTNETPYVGNAYLLKDEMIPVLENGQGAFTGIYDDDHGTWISGYGPVFNSAGEVVGLVEVDFSIQDYLSQLVTTTLLYAIIGLLSLGIVLPSLLIILRNIRRPIETIILGTNKIRGGDLTANIAVEADREIAFLADTFNEMVTNLKQIVSESSKAAGEVGKISSEISAFTGQQVSGIAQQSSAINETTTTLQEIRTISEQTREKANEVVTTARQSVEWYHAGQEAGKESMARMMAIRQKVERISNQIKNLKTQIDQIGSIAEAVNGLASEINLISLNATIQASKAGDLGRGFMVVANHVQKLAEQGKSSAEKIAAIIGEIKKSTDESAQATEEGMVDVNAGVEQIRDTSEIISKSVDAMEYNVEMAQQIFEASNQQSVAIEQILKAVEEINEVMKQITSGAKQSQDATLVLDTVSSELKTNLNRFEI